MSDAVPTGIQVGSYRFTEGTGFPLLRSTANARRHQRELNNQRQLLYNTHPHAGACLARRVPRPLPGPSRDVPGPTDPRPTAAGGPARQNNKRRPRRQTAKRTKSVHVPYV